MTAEQIKSNIKESLQAFAKGNLTEKSIELFEKLGYVTERRAPLHKPTFAEFKDTYIGDKKFDEAKAKTKDWKYVDLLFQLSKEEVQKQASLFDTKKVDRTVIETYLFFAIELSHDEYSRTELSVITREVNRLFPMPAMMLFKHGKTITVSAINRRLHKRDESKDVLEKVTLIKDIVIENPHRAHIEILFDISFDELRSKHQFTNFVELHNAWQKTLDTKELNKRFYSELFNWYLWAVRSVNFPNDVDNDKDDMVYNSENVIRLLTRLIFVWFIKEKNLVPDSLFELKKLKDILKDFKPQSAETSVYYRAVLQNLFFATLNTPMDKDITAENKDEQRRFINTLPKTGNDQYLDQTKYRYQNYFTTPDKALELFSSIPFLNGGLFECLDFKEGNKEIRLDGFSSTEKRQAFIPDKLFFAEKHQLDLNTEYGTKNKKYEVEGLINILDSYKFTITENTPLEEEIALDPELLGKVFENLLASYNPETQTTARKQTGSFYTPREIVNYMVDESLIAYFKQKLDNTVDTETKLRDLFTHVIDFPEFTKSEADVFIKAISEVKILDPACGSGAFPMGVLHRLVDLLNKLDPDNKKWNKLQIQRAIDETANVDREESNSEEQKFRLKEIDKAFDLNMNYPDYARKLFLIENCIYGVDIQQIAIQISKLRFFISLIVDQKVDDNKPNRNILSMPNLETKFVAANTLIALDKPQQMTLMTGDVERLEKELGGIRRKIFFTRKYSEKKILKKKEKAKREELQIALTQSGYTANVAGQMAGWNPFDPMKSAKFFDPETMFGFKDGFDVVIGNPPYIGERKNKNQFIPIQNSQSKKYYFGRMDYFYFFFHISLDALATSGICSFITTNYFPTALGARKLRTDLKHRASIFEIINFNEAKVFDSAAGQHNMITSFMKGKHNNTTKVIRTKKQGLLNPRELENILNSTDNETTIEIINEKDLWDGEENYIRLSGMNAECSPLNRILDKVVFKSTDLLGNICKPLIGLESSLDDVFVLSLEEVKRITRNNENELSLVKPFFKNSDVDRYSVKKQTDKYILYLHENIKNIRNYEGIWEYLVENQKEIKARQGANLRGAFKRGNWWVLNTPRLDMDFKDEKIVTPYRTKQTKFALSNDEWYASRDVYYIVKRKQNISLKYILALLNSKLYFTWFYNRGKRKGDTLEVYAKPLKEVPIFEISSSLQKPFIAVVDKILEIKEKDPIINTTNLENLIDEMVYKLYELTDEEIAIIEGKE